MGRWEDEKIRGWEDQKIISIISHSVITAFGEGLPRRRRDAKGNPEQAASQREM